MKVKIFCKNELILDLPVKYQEHNLHVLENILLLGEDDDSFQITVTQLFLNDFQQ